MLFRSAQNTQRQVLRKAAAQVDAKKLLGVVFNAADSGGSNKYYYRYYYGGNSEHK